MLECAFFAACLVAGEIRARRANPTTWRWLVNLSLCGLGGATGLALAPWLGVDPRDFAGTQSGLLGAVDAPPAVAAILTFLAYDLYAYATHRLMHAVPWLWRLHAIHHSDTGFDTSTHFRHHPLDHVVSLVFFAGFVLVLGPDPVGLACALLLHRCNSMLNHSNIAVPAALDRAVRVLVVTPDMHRIHHSARREETDSNFGNLLTCWDRLFGTCVAEPRGGQQAFELGLHEYTRAGMTGLWGQLCGPFTVRFAAGATTRAVGRLEPGQH